MRIFMSRLWNCRQIKTLQTFVNHISQWCNFNIFVDNFKSKISFLTSKLLNIKKQINKYEFQTVWKLQEIASFTKCEFLSVCYSKNDTKICPSHWKIKPLHPGNVSKDGKPCINGLVQGKKLPRKLGVSSFSSMFR